MTDAATFKFIARIKAIEILLIEDLTRWVRSQGDPRGFAEQYREKLRGQLEKMTMEGIEEPVHADAFAQEVQFAAEAIWDRVILRLGSE